MIPTNRGWKLACAMRCVAFEERGRAYSDMTEIAREKDEKEKEHFGGRVGGWRKREQAGRGGCKEGEAARERGDGKRKTP
eukprot:1654499-Rhodomonas_salina.5